MPRGRPPKSPRLHLVGGTYRDDRHGRDDGRGPAPPGQRLRARDKPPFVRGRAARLWAEALPKLPWLHRVDKYCLSLWCVLLAEFEADPRAMKAARISLLRLMASDIGLSAAGRARLGLTVAPPAEPDPYLD